MKSDFRADLDVDHKSNFFFATEGLLKLGEENGIRVGNFWIAEFENLWSDLDLGLKIQII